MAHDCARSPAGRFRRRMRTAGSWSAMSARVVEPFTGEGIFYAMRSGELAAAAVIEVLAGRASLPGVGESVSHCP